MSSAKSIFFVIALVLSTSSAFGDQNTSSEEINRASRLLVDGKVDEAITAFEKAAKATGYSDELTYNLGVASYRKGDLPRARSLFQKAMNSTNRGIAAKASFNLGNCDYREALTVSEQDYRGAIEKLNTAIDHYRNSLRIDSRDTEARQNIELALKLIDQLTKQQESQQNQDKEKEDDSEKDQNEEKQDQESPEEQEQFGSDHSNDPKDETRENEQRSDPGDSADQAESGEENGEKDSQQHDNNTGGGEDQKDQENSETSKAKSKDEQDPQDDQPQSENGGSSDDEPEDKSEEDSVAQSGQPDGQEKKQNSMDSGEDDYESEKPLASGSAGTSASGQPSGKMDRQQAMKLLQAIRDRDLMRRMEKLRNMNRRFIPVERDW